MVYAIINVSYNVERRRRFQNGEKGFKFWVIEL